jgi:Hemerythrin HHE cation binding domain
VTAGEKSAADEVAAQPAGEGMVAELKWVHDLIRRDLRTVRRLAADVEAGLPGVQAVQAVQSLAVGGPLWQLKVNCLQYCRFVHSHHHAESALLFPRLRLASPALGPVVDKLEADHARVSGLLDDVCTAAAALADQEDPAVRKRLAVALADLSEDLLAHLEYEEDNISGTLRTWTSWAGW